MNATTAQAGYLGGNPGTFFQSWVLNGDGTYSLLVAQTPATPPAFIATSGTAYDLTKYGSVQVQVETLAAGESVAVTGSLAVGGTKHPVANLLGQNTLNPSAVSSITVAGTYSVLFGGNKELVFTSSGGSPNTGVITVSGAQ
jgi:hypothetical protein